MLITGIGNGVTFPDGRSSVKPQPLSSGSQSREAIPLTLPGQDNVHNNSAEIKAKVADLERVSLAFNRKLQFVVDHETNEILVKVIDPETDKVIKILPPEELQRLHSKIRETIGFLFDEHV